MNAYAVRLVMGPAYDENGPELARILNRLLERAGSPTIVASYRRDSGVVVVATFSTDSAGGAAAAAGGIAELVAQAIDRGLKPAGHAAWARMLSHAVIKVSPSNG